jgi:hypothetical protein
MPRRKQRKREAPEIAIPKLVDAIAIRDPNLGTRLLALQELKKLARDKLIPTNDAQRIGELLKDHNPGIRRRSFLVASAPSVGAGRQESGS